VYKVFHEVVCFLTFPITNEFPELCELRNHLLTSSSTFKYISPKDLDMGPAYPTPENYTNGYFGDFGKPDAVLVVCKIVPTIYKMPLISSILEYETH
jgi:hypothetical protein